MGNPIIERVCNEKPCPPIISETETVTDPEVVRMRPISDRL
jgi:hypothetical protein